MGISLTPIISFGFLGMCVKIDIVRKNIIQATIITVNHFV